MPMSEPLGAGFPTLETTIVSQWTPWIDPSKRTLVSYGCLRKKLQHQGCVVFLDLCFLITIFSSFSITLFLLFMKIQNTEIQRSLICFGYFILMAEQTCCVSIIDVRKCCCVIVCEFCCGGIVVSFHTFTFYYYVLVDMLLCLFMSCFSAAPATTHTCVRRQLIWH